MLKEDNFESEEITISKERYLSDVNKILEEKEKIEEILRVTSKNYLDLIKFLSDNHKEIFDEWENIK